MQKKKPVKKDSQKKKFLFIDLEGIQKNIRFVALVMVIIVLLYSSFLILSKVADHFLDIPTKSFLVLVLILVVFYVVFPLVFESKNKIVLFFQFLFFPVVLFLIVRILGVKYLTNLWYLIPYLVFLSLWFYLYLLSLQRFPLKNFNYRAAYVVIGCLFLFVIGMLVAFNSVFDAQTKLGLYLNECETKERISGAHFTCEGLREDLFVGEQANCMIYGLEHDNLTTELIFTHFNGTSSYYAYSPGDSISFILPADVFRVHVNIQSESGKETCASSADNMTFTTYANFRQQLKELGFYFVAIISFILLYVPTIVNKWMDLFKRKGKK